MIAPAIDAAQPVQFMSETGLRQETIKESLLRVHENNRGEMTSRALAKYALNKLNVEISHHTVYRLINRYKKNGGDVRASIADGRGNNAPREQAKEYQKIAMDIVHAYVFQGNSYKKAHALMLQDAPKFGIHHPPTLAQVYNLNRHIPKALRPEILRDASAAVEIMRSQYPKKLYQVNEKWCFDETSFIVKDYVSGKEHVVMLSLTFDVETGFLRPYHYKVTDKFDRNADSTTRVKTGWTSADTIQALRKAMDKDSDICVHEREIPEGFYGDRHSSHLSDAVRHLFRKLNAPSGEPIHVDYSQGEDPRTNGLAERSIGYFKYQFLRGFLKRREIIAKNTRGKHWTTSLAFLPILLKEAAREYNTMVKRGRTVPRCEDYYTAAARVNSRVDWKEIDHCCRDFLKDQVFSTAKGIQLAPGFTYKNAGMYVFEKMEVWVAYRPGIYNKEIDLYEPAGAKKEPKFLGTLKHVEADSGELKARDKKTALRDAKTLHEALQETSDKLTKLSDKVTPAPADIDQVVVNYGVPEGVVDISTEMPPAQESQNDPPSGPTATDDTASSPDSKVIPFQQPPVQEDTETDQVSTAEEESPQTPTAKTRTRRQYKSAKI